MRVQENFGIDLSALKPTIIRKFSEGFDGHEYAEYFLSIGGQEFPLEADQAMYLACQVLPEDQLIWAVNLEKNREFYNRFYPEWSVFPTPLGWRAGNVYTRDRALAQKALENRLRQEIKAQQKYLEYRLEPLREKLNALETGGA